MTVVALISQHMEENNSDHLFARGDRQTNGDLKETVKWTKLLAVFGFVFIAVLLVVGVLTSIVVSNLAEYKSTISIPEGTGTIVLIFFCVVAGLLFYPNFTLYRYSVTLSRSLGNSDPALYAKEVRHMRNMFKYTGIVVIVVTALLIVDLAVALLR